MDQKRLEAMAAAGDTDAMSDLVRLMVRKGASSHDLGVMAVRIGRNDHALDMVDRLVRGHGYLWGLTCTDTDKCVFKFTGPIPGVEATPLYDDMNVRRMLARIVQKGVRWMYAHRDWDWPSFQRVGMDHLELAIHAVRSTDEFDPKEHRSLRRRLSKTLNRVANLRPRWGGWYSDDGSGLSPGSQWRKSRVLVDVIHIAQPMLGANPLNAVKQFTSKAGYPSEWFFSRSVGKADAVCVEDEVFPYLVGRANDGPKQTPVPGEPG